MKNCTCACRNIGARAIQNTREIKNPYDNI
jgi:hypothetical protein